MEQAPQVAQLHLRVSTTTVLVAALGADHLQ